MRSSASSMRSSLSLDSELPLWTRKDASHTRKKMCRNSDCQFSRSSVWNLLTSWIGGNRRYSMKSSCRRYEMRTCEI
jgi:hypothetical protein